MSAPVRVVRWPLSAMVFPSNGREAASLLPRIVMIGKKALMREISAAARVARGSDAMNTSRVALAYPVRGVSGMEKSRQSGYQIQAEATGDE